MKRSFAAVEFGSLDLARCLVMMSHGHESIKFQARNNKPEVFECKTCNRQFPSFQALGGHRASHKKPKLSETKPEVLDAGLALSLTVKPKMHECSICGLEFSMGQALGGHMRRHRADMMKDSRKPAEFSLMSAVPVLKRSNSTKRVMPLDLNLTPLENDLKSIFANMAPKIGQFI